MSGNGSSCSWRPLIRRADHLADRREIVDPRDALDLVPAIARLEREAVDEGDERADRLGPAEVGDVHAVDRAGDRLQAEDLLEALQALARVDVEDLGLGVLGEVAAQVERLERLDLVAEPGGLFEAERLARLAHLLLPPP